MMTSEHVLKPTNDLVFKALFGQESSKAFLKSLLEAVLGTRISSLSIVDPVLKIQDIGDKSPVLDVKVLTAENEYINVEVQVSKQLHFSNRSLYYWSRMYGSQLNGGDEYGQLKKAICINILDFRHFEGRDDFHSTFAIYEREHGEQLTDHLEIHFIELPKFGYDKHAVIQARNTLYEWLYFMRYAHKLSEEDLSLMSDSVQQAHDQFMTLSEDKILRLRAISYEIAERDRLTREGEERRMRRENEQKQRENEQKQRENEQKERENEQKEREVAEKEREVLEQKRAVEEQRLAVEKASREFEELSRSTEKARLTTEEMLAKIEREKQGLEEMQQALARLLQIGRHTLEDHKLEGQKAEAVEVLRELLMDLHSLDLTPYQEKVSALPLERIRALRQSLKKETSLVIRDLETL